ncbi:L,D-transpeptidase family protein [Rhodomicrobium sp.]|uniref:L,D-transpeptidase family protein n=1 Tax=Rhodomicrobium sp. TaxID=2720632 RepID=UPI0039E58B92
MNLSFTSRLALIACLSTVVPQAMAQDADSRPPLADLDALATTEPQTEAGPENAAPAPGSLDDVKAEVTPHKAPAVHAANPSVKNAAAKHETPAASDSPIESAIPDPLAPPEDDGAALLAPGAPAHPAAAAEAPAGDAVAPLVVERAANAGGKADARDDVGAVKAFYNATKGKPIWTTAEGFTPAALKTIREIRAADSYGLDATAFELPDSAGATPEARADAEVKLSLAVLKYARHARGGRLDPPSISPAMDRKPHVYVPKSVLEAIASADEADAYLRGLHPKSEQFKQLRQALIALGKATDSGAPSIRIPAGKTFKPGDDDAQIALIRKRLNAGLEAPRDTIYDEALLVAVNRFQKERGLEVNGIVDKKLRAALNEGVGVSVEEKKMRLIVNMERWRWMPDNLGDFYVWNSIPEQITRVYDRGRMVLQERIVVGKPASQTPSFSANMQFVIFNPEWGVPDGIKANEIAPKLRRAAPSAPVEDFFDFLGGRRNAGGGGGGGASSVLQRLGGLRVTYNGRDVDPDSVDWSRVDVRRYSFIQPAGPRNALGMVKFRFPNKHDVYMHDTPEKSLFGSATRAFSHGCMRTQNPLRFAEVILAYDNGTTPEQIRRQIETGQTVENKLTKTIPVHMVYFTAAPDEKGEIRYFSDLYGLDARVASALKGESFRFAGDPVVAVAQEPAQPQREARDTTSDQRLDQYGRPVRGADPYGREPQPRPRGREAWSPFDW